MKKSLLPEEFCPGNRLGTMNAFLDSLGPNAWRKIAPKRFLFTNRYDIFVCVTDLPDLISLDNRITLRAGKALRVMWCSPSNGKCTLVVREPPAGPNKLN